MEDARLYLTYRKKDRDWIGYCDGCKFPYVPHVVADFIEGGKKGKDKEFLGYCAACYRRLRNEVGGTLKLVRLVKLVKKVRKVKMVRC